MNIEEIMEKWRKDKLIICPHCGHEHDSACDPEMFEGHITYYGEDIAQEFGCRACPKVFFVKEHVERTFEEKKTINEFE